MIFLVNTAEDGRAIATFLMPEPARRTARRTPSVTASKLAMLPSATAPRGSASIT